MKQQCTLLRTHSVESDKVIDLLRKNNIEFESNLHYSNQIRPVLITPEGVYPYDGLEEIEEYVTAKKKLKIAISCAE